MGLSLKLQGRTKEAFAAFYKSVWSAAWQDSGYFSLAQIACAQGSYEESLELAERSLIRNTRNYKCRHLISTLLRKLGRYQEVRAYSEETLRLDVADFGEHHELFLSLKALQEPEIAEEIKEQMIFPMRDNVYNYLSLASDYSDCGLFEEAIELLTIVLRDNDRHTHPMLHYTLGYFFSKTGNQEAAALQREYGASANPEYCFPNSYFDLEVLENTLTSNPEDAKAHYYMGNLLYDKRRPQDAVAHWEASRSLDSTFPTVHRNLALAYFNKLQKPEEARTALETAFACDSLDPRVFYELDKLYKKLGMEPGERLKYLEVRKDLVQQRDDLYLEFVTLHSTLGSYAEVIQLLSSRIFHPWEGGEGKNTGQHVLAHVELAKSYQDLALIQLGSHKYAKRRFNKLVDYAEKHLFDDVKVDYFAVSLPDFLVFDDDLNRRNRIHCLYMRGLGLYGLGNVEKAGQQFREVLALEPNHQGAHIHLQL